MAGHKNRTEKLSYIFQEKDKKSSSVHLGISKIKENIISNNLFIHEKKLGRERIINISNSPCFCIHNSILSIKNSKYLETDRQV